MANAFYVKGKEKILSAAINFSVDTIKVALVKNTYLQSLTTDEFLSEITAHVIGTDQTLSGKSIATGAFDADDIIFPAVAAGSTAEGVVIYKDTGNPATSPLIAYIDTITGFPYTTNNGDVLLQWDNGTYKIFLL